MEQKLLFNRYLKGFVFVTIFLLLFVVAFNWFIDPYDIYNSPKIKGINALNAQDLNYSSITKAYAVSRIKPESIVLGTSRSGYSIDPEHGGWSYKPAYNLALPGASVYEMLRYFQHTNNIRPLKQTVLFLDFFIFNVYWRNFQDFDESRLSVSSDGSIKGKPFLDLPTLFSADATNASIKTIRNQVNTQTVFLKNGLWEFESDGKGNHERFLETYKTFFNYWVPIGSGHKYQLEDPGISQSPFDYYRQILQIAYRDNIDLRLATSPCHVLLWEALDDAGLWPQFTQWKRSLVKINEEEARRAGKDPFPLWDFSVYNKFTTESLPALSDAKTEMKWYREASHYKKELGDLVLDRIFDYHGSGQSAPADLGILLTSKNIEEHLQKVISDRENYRNTHPDDVKEVAQQYKQYLSGSKSL